MSEKKIIPSVREDVPLLKMPPSEFEDAMDSCIQDIDVALIRDARAGEVNSIALAVLFLLGSGGSKKIVTYVPEYGDGDGFEQLLETAARMRRTVQLQEGESLEVHPMEFLIPVQS